MLSFAQNIDCKAKSYGIVNMKVKKLMQIYINMGCKYNPIKLKFKILIIYYIETQKTTKINKEKNIN